MPGMTHPTCNMGSDMPPHYCEPTYHVGISVKGLEITDVEPMDETALMFTINEIIPSDGIAQNLVLVDGGGNLAGATIVDEGWSESTTVHLELTGTGTIYDTPAIHLHVFPYTGE